MRKLSCGLFVSLLMVLMSACSSSQKPLKKTMATRETIETRAAISNGEYLDQVMEVFKDAELIMNEHNLEIKEIEKEYYQKVKVIKAFDSEEKQTGGEVISQSSNKMLGGLLLEFASARDMIELINFKKNTWYFDDIGIDDNFITPKFFSNNERLIVLQLNNKLPASKVKEFERLLSSIGEPSEALTDWQLVETIIGEWSGDGGLTVIKLDKGQFRLNEEPLTIDGTDGMTVYAHQVADKEAHYEFQVTDQGVTLLTSYPLEKTSEGLKGGDVAPIELVRQTYEVLTIDDMLGDWQSVEAEQPAFIHIEETDAPDQLDIFIAEKSGEVVEPIRLKAKYANDADRYLQFVDQDEILYEFGYSGKAHWYLSSGTDNPDGTGEVYSLERGL